jgi:hypothetical protein
MITLHRIWPWLAFIGLYAVVIGELLWLVR